MTRLFMHNCVHVVLTFIMLTMSWTLLGDASEVFTHTHSYTAMARVATAQQWGLFTGLIGFFGVATMFTSRLLARIAGAVVLSFGHGTIAVYFYLGNPYGAGSKVWFGYAILGLCLAYSKAYLGFRFTEGVARINLT